MSSTKPIFKQQFQLFFILIPKLICYTFRDLFRFIKLIIKAKLDRKEWVVVSLMERFGDIIAAEPVFRKISYDHPHHIKIWVIGEKLLTLGEALPYQYHLIPIKYFDEWIFFKKLLPKHKVIDLHLSGRCGLMPWLKLVNPNKKGITHENYFQFGNLLTMFSVNYPIDTTTAPLFPVSSTTQLPFSTTSPYIVIHTASEEAIKNWSTREWKKLIQHFINLGYTIYEVGFKQSPIEMKGLFHCSSITIPQTVLLIKNAFLFIGVDSGPAHLANAVGTYGFILQGKYRHFEKYMVFSGDYQNGKNATIYQHADVLSELKFEDLLPVLAPVIINLTRKNV